ncbi:MAG: PD-(D/E)XK nuclease family protein, partial [Rudaea sp.]
SFSALTRMAVADVAEPAAADESEVIDVATQEFADILATAYSEPQDVDLLAIDNWRGRRFGNAVHKVLELAGPGDLWPLQRGLVGAQLSLQAVRDSNDNADDVIEPVARMIDRVRNTDLGEGLRLIDVDAGSRITEFEFQFPARTTVAQLRAVCAEHGHPHVVPEHLSVPALNGMLTGFADLIFVHAGRYHVLDYKTNRLGTQRSDYRAAALDAAMAQHHYEFQALLYTVALHRYLRQRLRDYAAGRHLGESWYLFLRAVGLEPGLGICRRRWPAPLIVALDEAFVGLDEAAA